MERQQWFLSKCSIILSHLPPGTQTLLRSGRAAQELSTIRSATIVALICYMHVRCRSSDEIASHLQKHHVPSAFIEEIAMRLVVPAKDIFRRRKLPFDTWWDIRLIFISLLIYYIESQMRRGVGAWYIKLEMATLWPFDEENANALLGEARDSIGWLAVSQPTDADDEVGQIIRNYVDSEETTKAVQSRLGRFPILAERLDLQLALRKIVVAHSIDRFVDQIDASLRDRVLHRLEEEMGSLRQFLRTLTPIESTWFEPGNEEQYLLARWLDQMKNVYLSSDIESLPDTLGARQTFPSWMISCVFDMGARAMHQSAGMVPYAFIAMEEHDTLKLERIGMAPPEVIGGMLLWHIVLIDANDEEMFAPLRFSLDAIDHVHDLVLILINQAIRIDVVQILPGGGLDLMLSRTIDIPDAILDSIRSVVLSPLRELVQDTNARADHLLVEELSKEEPQYGFLICETSKSEHLFVEFEESQAARTFSDASGITIINELVAEKNAMLRALAEKAESLDANDGRRALDLQPVIDRHARRVNQLRQHWRGFVEDSAPASRSADERVLRKLVGSLSSPKRCFVHFQIRNSYMNVFWARPNGSDIDCGRIDLSHINLDKLFRAASAFLGATDSWSAQDALDGVIECLGPEFTLPIVNALKPLGIEHLIISPVSLLESIPLHCAAVASGSTAYLCDVFERISYAPSARVLERLVAHGSVRLNSAIAFSYRGADENVPNIDREVEVLSILFPSCEAHQGALVSLKDTFNLCTDRSIVHIAGHGRGYLNDSYSSGIRMCPVPGIGRYLSAARILEMGSFENAGVVVISACESGKGGTPPGSIQRYTGLDSAFLARGARSVVSAMWKVHDLASLLFVAILYHELSTGATVDAACAAAMLALREGRRVRLAPEVERVLDAVNSSWRHDLDNCSYDFSRPYFWASFKCAGYTWATSGDN